MKMFSYFCYPGLAMFGEPTSSSLASALIVQLLVALCGGLISKTCIADISVASSSVSELEDKTLGY